jgi:hypothetical protein
MSYANDLQARVLHVPPDPDRGDHFIDAIERRTRFLFEASRRSDSTGH